MLSPFAQKVQDTLSARGFVLQVIELPRSTRTSQEAADAVGCALGQIAKSIIFRAAGATARCWCSPPARTA